MSGEGRLDKTKGPKAKNYQSRGDQNVEADRIVRCGEVGWLTGLGRTTIWRREREGKFPARVRLSAGAVGYRLSEVMAWLEGLDRA
jgi:prophage regulatory protein